MQLTFYEGVRVGRVTPTGSEKQRAWGNLTVQVEGAFEHEQGVEKNISALNHNQALK